MSEQEFHQKILSELKEIKEEQAAMNLKIDPMYDVFSKVTGFNQVSIQIMKTMGLIAVALGGFYALIEFFKRIGKT